MMDINSREAKVREFFNTPNLYLEKRFGVDIREYIVRQFLGDVTRSNFLDIGCGDGSLSLQYATQENHLTLIDLSDEMLELARQNAQKRSTNGICYLNIDFFEYVPDQPFDVVLCIGVLAHAQSLESVIKKLHGFLNSGGRCIVQFTDHDSWIAKIKYASSIIYKLVCGNPYKYSIQRFSYPKVLSSFIQNGFKLQDQCRYSILLPGMGRLPDKILYQHQLNTLKWRWLSRFGSEVILLLEKS